MSRMTNKSRAGELFVRADQCDENGDYRNAFRLMLSAAKLGDIGAQVNVGNYYDAGTGVRRNRNAALYWYKRAYRRGDASAASNIGVLYRNEKQLGRALPWFRRAVKLGDKEAHLEIGKHYLRHESRPDEAIPHFKHVIAGEWVTEAGIEEARKLLAEAKLQVRR